MKLATKKKYPLILYCTIILTIILFLIIVLNYQNSRNNNLHTNKINFKLITSTHSNLEWEFKPASTLKEVKIGEVTNIEYTVKNLGDKRTSGIASFSYYPRELDKYINKIECFCYDVKTLDPGEVVKYILTMVIDPEVTKNSNTKSIKEAIIQFTFFNSKNYKENNS